MAIKTYYDKFGLNENASAKDIKIAYRRLALKYHPDKNGGDPKFDNIFKQINEIYETLSDREKRRSYDYRLKVERDNRNRVPTDNNTQYSTGNTTTKEYSTNKDDEFEIPAKGKNFFSTVGGWVIALYIISVVGKMGNSMSSSSNKTGNYDTYKPVSDKTDSALRTRAIKFGTEESTFVLKKDSVIENDLK